MRNVFVVQHEHEWRGGKEVKLIGVYANRADAEAAIARLRSKPGFCKFPDGFSLDEFVLGRDHWTGGFSTTDRGHLEGGEFDWFAIDRAGKIAMFSTAGAGFIPEVVVAGHAEHSRIANDFPTPHWGSTQVWDDFAALGLYVYDWAGNDIGSYRRQRVPSGEMADDLRARLLGLTSMPRLDYEFQDCESIPGGELEKTR